MEQAHKPQEPIDFAIKVVSDIVMIVKGTKHGEVHADIHEKRDGRDITATLRGTEHRRYEGSPEEFILIFETQLIYLLKAKKSMSNSA